MTPSETEKAIPSTQRQRDKLAGPQRAESHIVELLFVFRKHHRAPFQIDAQDLIKINDREHQRPEDRWPEYIRLREEIGDVGKSGGNGKPTEPQDIPHEYETRSSIFENAPGSL
jgi:hypothetical protein